MSELTRRRSLCGIGMVMLAYAIVAAQRLTIPELVRQGAVGSVATTPSGQTPTVAALLDQTETLAVGILSNPRSYLSEDETEVLTDYELSDQTILFSAKSNPSPTPAIPRPLTLTQKGGTVVVNGVSFTEKQPALEPLKPGTRVLCLLRSVGNRNMIVGEFFGIFNVQAGLISPLVTRPEFAPEYQNVDYRAAVDSMLRMLRSAGR